MKLSFLRSFIILTSIVLGFSLANASSIDASASRYDQLRSLYLDNISRFDASGRFLHNYQQTRDFLQEQESFVQQMKQIGAIKEVLFVENDYKSSFWVKIYTFQSESGRLIAFYYEKGSYYDEEERSYLRFVNLPALGEGLNLGAVMGTHILNIKGYYFTPESGGTLQFRYAKDLKKNLWGTLNLFCLYKNENWNLYTESYQAISKAFITTWMWVLPPNGGVKNISTY